MAAVAEYLGIATTRNDVLMSTHYPPSICATGAVPEQRLIEFLHVGQGSITNRYSLPIEMLRGTNWNLLDCSIVAADGAVKHPCGQDVMGYLIISTQNYAAMSIAPKTAMKGDTFISYTGKLNVDNDNNIRALISSE